MSVMERLSSGRQEYILGPMSSSPIRSRRRRRSVSHGASKCDAAGDDDQAVGAMLLLDDVEGMTYSECLHEIPTLRENKRPRTTPSSSMSPSDVDSNSCLNESMNNLDKYFPVFNRDHETDPVPTDLNTLGQILADGIPSNPRRESPLGTMNLQDLTGEAELMERVDLGSPGSSCSPEGYISTLQPVTMGAMMCSRCYSCRKSPGKDSSTQEEEPGFPTFSLHPGIDAWSDKSAAELDSESPAGARQSGSERCDELLQESPQNTTSIMGTQKSPPEASGHLPETSPGAEQSLVGDEQTARGASASAGTGEYQPASPVQAKVELADDVGDDPPSPSPGRSPNTSQKLREDLALYMAHVRTKIGNDGTPAVTFPRNFDHVVRLMDRRDLMVPQGGKEGEGVENPTPGFTADGNPAIQRAAKASSQERLPWAKFLLDEGLDCTEAFSKYKGVLSEEHTREDRLMRGLAKMRELDLRLAEATRRARELAHVARDASRNAGTAARAGALGGNETDETDDLGSTKGNRHPQRRGPTAVDDACRVPWSGRGEVDASVATPTRTGSSRPDTTIQGAMKPTPHSDRLSRRAPNDTEDSTKGGNGPHPRREGRRAFVTQKFRGHGPSRLTPSKACATPSIGDFAGEAGVYEVGLDARDRESINDDNDSRGGRDAGGCDARGGAERHGAASFVLRNKDLAGKPAGRLTEDQEHLVSRFLADDDGFDQNDEQNGDPGGIWAEIAAYGGQDAGARIAEIDARLHAMNAEDVEDAVGDTVGVTDDDLSVVEGDAIEPPNAKHASFEGSSAEEVKPGEAGGNGPGEPALRNHRRIRAARERSRALDAALAKLQTPGSERSELHHRDGREAAIDEALDRVRSAPLSLETGAVRPVHRLSSLLSGKGPQPVREWDVKHALQQGREELRGKELASRAQIEDLVAAVRDGSSFAWLAREREDGGRNGDLGDVDPAKFAAEAASVRGSRAYALTTSELSETGGIHEEVGSPSTSGSSNGNRTGSPKTPPLAEASSEEKTVQGPRDAGGGTVRSAVVDQRRDETNSPPRPPDFSGLRARSTRQSRKSRSPGIAMPPEVTALFRAPLLSPSAFLPPVPGIAAAAVASGGCGHPRSGNPNAASLLSGGRARRDNGRQDVL